MSRALAGDYTVGPVDKQTLPMNPESYSRPHASAPRQICWLRHRQKGPQRPVLQNLDVAQESDAVIMRMLNWFNLIDRLSTCAITSFWIGDIIEHVLTTISLNRTTGESS